MPFFVVLWVFHSKYLIIWLNYIFKFFYFKLIVFDVFYLSCNDIKNIFLKKNIIIQEKNTLKSNLYHIFKTKNIKKIINA